MLYFDVDTLQSVSLKKRQTITENIVEHRKAQNVLQRRQQRRYGRNIDMNLFVYLISQLQNNNIFFQRRQYFFYE